MVEHARAEPEALARAAQNRVDPAVDGQRGALAPAIQVDATLSGAAR